MKKYSILFIVFFQSIVGIGQEISTQPINTELPSILPPSPTVASLMKFEEVPVSNYTGIPNISIPIFQSQTHSKDINVNISLDYHPSSIAADEVASYVGLGWNLIAGGTISRTVRGLPDDINEYPRNHNINQDMLKGIYFNDYYWFLGAMGPNFPLSAINRANDFLYEAAVLGTRDSEHDLYQVNFMGHTSRFYIKKEYDRYSVIKLSNEDSLLIEYDFENKIFTVYDDKGYKYIFDIKEYTSLSSSSDIIYIDGSEFLNLSSDYSYTSAFHLSQVRDSNNKLLIEYKYEEGISEVTSHSAETFSKMIGNESDYVTAVRAGNERCYTSEISKFDPTSISQSNTQGTSTKKLKQIDVVDYAKIYFVSEQGRQDYNLNQTAHRLKSIIIKDSKENIIKSFDLIHSYSTHSFSSQTSDNRLRLMLKEVKTNFGNKSLSTYLKYKEILGETVVGKDHWGYFNSQSNYHTNRTNEPNSNYCTLDVLERISYPTGGNTVFDFESNTYSYTGNQEITDFDKNSENFDNSAPYTKSFQSGCYTPDIEEVSLGLALNDSYVAFTLQSSDSNSFFQLIKHDNGKKLVIQSFHCGSIDGTCKTDDIFLEKGFLYTVRFNRFTLECTTASMTVQLRVKKNPATINKWLLGGGIRIKDIKYFDKDIDYFPDMPPAKEKKYDYRFFDPLKSSLSSGSLTFAKPVYSYPVEKHHHIIICGKYDDVFGSRDYDITYNKTTNFNNLPVSSTHGSYIGYRNVKVYETGNGYTEYTYTSPIEFYEDTYNTITPPFLPSKNIDYKRGLILSEKQKDSEDRIRKEMTYDYNYIESEEMTGLKMFIKYYCRYLYAMGPEFSINIPVGGLTYGTCGSTAGDFVGFAFNYEAFGWAKLMSKNTKEYFYDSMNVPAVLETNETFDYYPYNKKLSRSAKTTSNDNEKLVTRYWYHSGVDSDYSKNRISELEQIFTSRSPIDYNISQGNPPSSQILATTAIVYDKNWTNNQAYLPKTIQASKGSDSLENRVRYNAYDEFGNPLEVQQENGTIISYIWGYNKTQPIAKIENVTNAQLASALGKLNDVNETDLGRINDLRQNANFSNAMITTYTYIPLVGVSTITDPKGDTIKYEYDDFGRLKTVRDNDNNILSENEYHYRTQN